jgi:hypothetical protein
VKTTKNITLIILGLFVFASGAHAQSPREQWQQLVSQLQTTPTDTALRERIIKLAAELKPAPAIPEEAREPFVMGVTVLKKASDPAGASKAADLFTRALAIAPWFADAYYNRAMARETAGQYELAIADIKLYLGFKLTDNERREAQDKMYALKADALLGTAKKTEQDKAAAEKEHRVQKMQGTWIDRHDGLVSYWTAQTTGEALRLSADRYVTASGTTNLSGSWGEFRLKAENGGLKGVYVEGTQKRACTGRESPTRATISADGRELTVITTVHYIDHYVNANGETQVDRVNCRHSPQPEWRMILRKQ